MASLSKEMGRPHPRTKKRKTYWRVMVFVDGVRKTVRLGAMTKEQAEGAKRHIEALNTARIDGSSPMGPTSEWLAGVDKKLRERLVKAGLARPVATKKAQTLGQLIAMYTASKYPHFSERTKSNHEQAIGAIKLHWGMDRLLDEITPGDAEDLYAAMKLQKKRNGDPLADDTIIKRCSIASQILGFAVKHRIIAGNPFNETKVPRNTQGNKERQQFISSDDARKVLDQLPGLEWKLLFSLSRWGGLRVGSEPRLLKYGHVDVETQRIEVTSPKTRHCGKGRRFIPIFPELADLLQERCDEMEPGDEYLLQFMRRVTDAGLRKPLLAAIKRAGLEPWPRLWHNLRASRQTELQETFPSHVVCEWLGNSVAIAAKHYLQVTEEHWSAAAHNPAHHATTPADTDEKEAGQAAPMPLVFPANDAECHSVVDKSIPRRGVEPLSPP